MRWRKNERERLIAQRLAISNDERVDHARRIVDNLDTLLPDLAGLSVSLYWPFRGEVARHLLMRRDGGRQPRTYHWSALGNATALASENLYRPVHGHRTTHHVTVASQWLDPLKPRTTNGLSSNRNACASYGCVDAGGGGD